MKKTCRRAETRHDLNLGRSFEVSFGRKLNLVTHIYFILRYLIFTFTLKLANFLVTKTIETVSFFLLLNLAKLYKNEQKIDENSYHGPFTSGDMFSFS